MHLWKDIVFGKHTTAMIESIKLSVSTTTYYSLNGRSLKQAILSSTYQEYNGVCDVWPVQSGSCIYSFCVLVYLKIYYNMS